MNLKNPKSLAIAAAGLFLVAAVLAFISLQSPSGRNVSAGPRVAKVTVTAGGFVPATLSITKNTKVIWTNGDNKLHRIQANPHPTGDSLPGLKSEVLANGHTYEYTFTKTGTYAYHDFINPTTNGTIEVHN